MKPIRRLFQAGVSLALVLTVASCRTIQFREVQSDFNRAVEGDNARSESPFIDWYQSVAATLTDDYISKLDEKLRPNAWMLRGYSEWRSGSYSNANATAAKGWREIERQRTTTSNPGGSRDAILLTMLPGLVQDSRLRDRLKLIGTNELAAADYRTNYQTQFIAVLDQFREAKEKFAAPTPPAVKLYWNFQTWRVLQNWNITLGKLAIGEPPTKQAYVKADAAIVNQFNNVTSGTNLVSAIQAVKLAIPTDHVYRRLIEFEEKQ